MEHKFSPRLTPMDRTAQLGRKVKSDDRTIIVLRVKAAGDLARQLRKCIYRLRAPISNLSPEQSEQGRCTTLLTTWSFIKIAHLFISYMELMTSIICSSTRSIIISIEISITCSSNVIARMHDRVRD